MQSKEVGLRAKLLEIMDRKMLESYNLLRRWDESVKGDLGFKWNRYIKRCIVEVSSKQLGDNDSFSRTVSISPFYKYLPDLRVRPKDQSTTLEQFFVDEIAKEIIQLYRGHEIPDIPLQNIRTGYCDDIHTSNIG